MKNAALEKHFITIKDQLALVVNTERIHDSTNPIQLLYDNVLSIRNNGRVITDEEFTNRLNVVLGDTYKTLNLRIDSLLLMVKDLSFSYFEEKLDIKEYRYFIYEEALKRAETIYGNKVTDIDFIYVSYYMTELINQELRNISSRKLSEVTRT